MLFCYKCDAKVVGLGPLRRECNCTVIINGDHEFGTPYPKIEPADHWIHHKELTTAYRQLQAHAAASGCTVSEWMERANTALTLLEKECGSLEWGIAHFQLHNAIEEAEQ